MRKTKSILWAQILVFLTIFISFSFICAQIATSVSEILTNPDKYDNKAVQVPGKCINVKHKVSRKGNPYTVFELADKGGSIKVFSFGYLAINEGDKVIVKGIYQKVKMVGPYIFYNEIDASNGEIRKIKQ
ncbi:MAG: hypothetical protein ACPLSJ_03340 [Thermosulfidibacteraceae bacterium]|jgi:hypothetical protein